MSGQPRRAERVQKVLAQAGVASRRASEELIAQSRVAVDGVVVSLGDKVDPDRQVVTVDGERVPTNPSIVYLLLNKPTGVVTTLSDPQGRPTVADFVPARPRVYPVGRLDQDTEGLILLTNDGELANRLVHPRYEVPKTYMAQVQGRLRKQDRRKLIEGIELDDGPARAHSARELGASGKESLVEIVVTEGRKRQVRRMLTAVGLPIQRLARVSLGPLALGDTKPGKFRPLNGAEVRSLYRAVELGDPEEADAPDTGEPGADERESVAPREDGRP